VNADGGDISEGECFLWIMREIIVWRTVGDEVVSLHRSSPSL